MAPRTTLRWRLTLVYAAVAVVVGLALLALSLVLVDQVLSASRIDLAGVVQLPDGRLLTLRAYQDQLRTEALGRLLREGLVGLVVLGAAGVAAGYALSGRALRPLQAITAAARRLSAEQLDARIALSGPHDELTELADTFDAMLDRLQASFEAQRRFVADASHELRTPLAVMRTEVDVALANPRATREELRAAAQVVRDATMRADQLVDSLLLLARTDRLAEEGLPHPERVELPEICRLALSAVAAEVSARGLLVSSSYGQAAVLGDRALLERLVGNLVENAVRHNLTGGWLRVDTGLVDGRARVQVMSSGPVVPPEEVPGLFEPFRRRARTGRRGAGLGLAIVRAVARAHAGEVTALARPEGGLTVTVDLPAVA